MDRSTLRQKLQALGAWLLILGCSVLSSAGATVLQPNGEYRETVVDLSVKTLGGYATVTRSWQADDENKGAFRWYFNPNWADLQFTYDSIDGTPLTITRAGAVFTKVGTGTFVFDQIYVIKQTTNPAGWRWNDPYGNWISYSADGKIASYGDRNNVGVSFTRNGDGTLNQVKDQNGRVVLTYQYAGGQISGIADYSGRSVNYQYDGTGALTQVTDVLGNNWSYAYGSGLLTSKTDPLNHTTTIAYSGNHVVQITDPMGFQTNYNYAYDHLKLIYTTVETSPAGVRTETHYDRNGKLIYKQIGMRTVYQMVKDGSNVETGIDERGLKTRTVYDTRRNVLQVTYPDGTSTSATYEALYSNITSRADELGIQTKYEYDSKGNLTKLTEAVGLPEQRVTVYTYDNFGQRLTQTIKGMAIPNGVTPGTNDTQYLDAMTVWTYDSSGNLGTLTDPLGHATTFTEDVMGNVLTRKDARVNVTTYEYDAAGRLTTVIDALNHTMAYGYDSLDDITSITDALNNTVTFGYDANRRRTSITDPLNNVSRMEYDNDARMTTRTDSSNVSLTATYDGDGRLATITDGTGNSTRWQYGDATNGLSGLVAGVIYPTYSNLFKYDTRSRKTQSVRVLPGSSGQPDQQQISAVGYDAGGNPASVTDELGNSTLLTFDALGRQVKETDSLGAAISAVLDSRDNLLAIRDGNGNVHHFTYDLADRQTADTTPMGGTIQYAYDETNNVTIRTSPRGDRRVYTYDGANRRTLDVQYPTNSNTARQQTIFSYDERNLLVGYSQTGDTISSAAYTFNARGEKTDETVAYGAGANSLSKTIHYVYYPNGLAQSFTYPDGTVVSYGYSANNLLSNATRPDGGIVQFTNFVWNTPTTVQMPGVVRSLMLDSLQRPTKIKAQALGNGTVGAPNGAIVMDYDYTYDRVGNVVKRITEDGEYNYTYDKLSRLSSALPPLSLQASPSNPNGLPIEQYTYDSVGNRVSSAHQPGPWSYSADNELLSYGIGNQLHTYQYDVDGNAINQTIGDPSVPSSVRTLTFDSADRLVRVDDNGVETASYQYDPLGRRIRKQVAGKVTWYQYANEGLVAEYDGSGALNRAYGWKPQTLWGTELLWLADINGASWSVQMSHNDFLGMPQRMTDSGGSITWKEVSDAFGRTSTDVSSVIANPLRFPGQYFDVETGYNNNYLRDYDPLIGRYIQSDPAGLAGGANAYAYALSNPLAGVDPYGLSVIWYNPSNGTVTIITGSGFIWGTYPAANNVDSHTGQTHPIAGGTYSPRTGAPYFPYAFQGPNSSYGSNGIYFFDVPGCDGCGFHSGQADKGGPQHPTHGCIRSNDDATAAVGYLKDHGDPPTSLEVGIAPPSVPVVPTLRRPK